MKPLLISICLFFVTSVVNCAEIVSNIIQSGLKEKRETSSVLSGVFGYTESCNYAIYLNRNSAIRMDANSRIELETTKAEWLSIGDGNKIVDIIGSYVLTSGKIVKNVSSNLYVIRDAEVYHKFDTDNSVVRQCVPVTKGTLSVSLGQLIAQPLEFDEKRISIIGVLTLDGNKPTLYSNYETANGKVWAESVPFYANSENDMAQIRDAKNIGHLVRVEATLLNRKKRSDGSLVRTLGIANISSINVLDSEKSSRQE